MNDFDVFQKEIDAMSLEDLTVVENMLKKKVSSIAESKAALCHQARRRGGYTEIASRMTRLDLYGTYYERKRIMIAQKITERFKAIGIL